MMTSQGLLQLVLLLVLLPACLAKKNNGKKCYQFDEGYNYQGTLQVTQGGIKCQRWDSQSPHPHDRYTDPAEFKKKISLENYCRVGDGETGRPWCYTTDPNVLWDYCDVEACNVCKNKKSTCPTEYDEAECKKKWSIKNCAKTCKVCGCPPGKWGENCANDCTCGEAECDYEYGCSRQCPAGKFGENCDKTCHCADSGEQCDVNTGNCKSGCAPGWRETGCQSQCPSGWESAGLDGRPLCLKHFPDPLGYHDAKKSCWSLEGNTNLAMPKDEEINAVLKTFRRTNANFWIGLDDWMHEGDFVWTDGSYLLSGYSNWRSPGEPSNGRDEEHCVEMDRNGIWGDNKCANQKPYVCQLALEPEPTCADTAGVVELDGSTKSCGDYITQYGNFMCQDSVVNKLCCQTCSQAENIAMDNVKYPDKYTVDILFTIDDRAFQKFKQLQTYPMTDDYYKFLMKKSIYDDNVSYMKHYFDLDLNVTINVVGIEIPDRNFNQPFEDGSYVRSHGLFSVYADYLRDSGLYVNRRFDVAVLVTGYTFKDGSPVDPGHNGPAGLASTPGACNNGAISVIKYYGVPQWNYGTSHEVGHQLSLQHMTGGIMYGDMRDGHKFNPNQLTLVHNYLDQYWRGDKTDIATVPGEFPVGSAGDQMSYIGANCMRDSMKEPANPNIGMEASLKTPDQLCKNVYGNNSGFCHYSAFYGEHLPTGDALCSNMHCIVGAHWECSKLREVELSTEGMVCSINGKTCQNGKCVASGAVSACPAGQFGDFCEKTCHCADITEVCDATGACSSGCNAQSTGDDCQTPVCPDGYTPYPPTGKCYKITNSKPYFDVQSECREQEGKSDMAMAKSPDVEDFLRELRGDKNSLWLGLNELDTLGTWRWSDGSYAYWANWYKQPRENNVPGHLDAPDNLGADEWHCTNFGKEFWGSAHCDNLRPGACEVDVARYSEIPHPICPNGEQSLVTFEMMNTKVSCRDIIKNFGPAACAGDFPIKGMKDICCETCRAQLKEMQSAGRRKRQVSNRANAVCLYQEGRMYLEGRWIPCAEYLQRAPEGNQACRERGFFTMCCQSCSAKFSQAFLDVCDYGSVNKVKANSDMQDMSCGDLLSQRGPGVCGLKAGSYGLSKPINKQCCDECSAVENPTDECVYDDGKLLSGNSYVSCDAYLSTNGYTACAEKEVSQVCCKICNQHAKDMQALCEEGWTYSVLTGKCYMALSGGRKFQDAVDDCDELDARLPQPGSVAENLHWTKVFKWQSQTWIDLSARLDNGHYVWKWGDNSPLDWTDWILGDDNIVPEKDLCAYITTAGWGQTDCTPTNENQQTKLTVCVKDV